MIGIALLLTALTGGMFLLAKTQKDNLNIFFKIISWFVIILSLGAIICCGIRCAARGCCKEEREGCHKNMMMRGGCEMGGGECEEMRGCGNERFFTKRIMIRDMDDDDGECEDEGKGNCKTDEKCKMGAGEKKDCCKKMEMKKDSAFVKH